MLRRIKSRQDQRGPGKASELILLMRMVPATSVQSTWALKISQPRYCSIPALTFWLLRVICALIQTLESKRSTSQSSTPLHSCTCQVVKIWGNVNQRPTCQNYQRLLIVSAKMMNSLTTDQLSCPVNYLMIERALTRTSLHALHLISSDCTRQRASTILMAFSALPFIQRKIEEISTTYGLWRIINKLIRLLLVSVLQAPNLTTLHTLSSVVWTKIKSLAASAVSRRSRPWLTGPTGCTLLNNGLSREEICTTMVKNSTSPRRRNGRPSSTLAAQTSVFQRQLSSICRRNGRRTSVTWISTASTTTTSAKWWLLARKLHQSCIQLASRLLILSSRWHPSSICIRPRALDASSLFIRTKWRAAAATFTSSATHCSGICTKYTTSRMRQSHSASTDIPRAKSKCTSLARGQAMALLFRPTIRKCQWKPPLVLTNQSDQTRYNFSDNSNTLDFIHYIFKIDYHHLSPFWPFFICYSFINLFCLSMARWCSLSIYLY